MTDNIEETNVQPPYSRREILLQEINTQLTGGTAGNIEELVPPPYTREEILLIETLTAIESGGGGSDSAEPYYITITDAVTATIHSTNRTMDEILAAYNAGKRLRLVMDIGEATGIAALQAVVNDDTAIFACNAPHEDAIYTVFVFNQDGFTNALANLFVTSTVQRETFYVTITMDGEYGYSSDKTYPEIYTAYTAGARIICHCDSVDDGNGNIFTANVELSHFIASVSLDSGGTQPASFTFMVTIPWVGTGTFIIFLDGTGETTVDWIDYARY